MSGLDEVPAERRRLDAVGFEAAAEVELLALVLRSEAKARAVLQDLGGLVAVQRASLQRLQRVPGLGRAGAAALRAAFVLGRRAMILDAPFGRKIAQAADVAEFLRASIGADDQETLLVLGLDQHLRLQVVRTVGTGSPTKVVILPREVFRPLIEAGMHAAVLVHNHPSGDPTPSADDVEFTSRMVEAGRIVGISVVDHVVVTRQGFASLGDLGMMVSH